MYTGTLGRKHNPQLLWALSEVFRDDPDVVIVVVATGASANELAELQARAPRSNLKLMRPQPMEDFPDVLGSADVLLTLLESDAAEFSVPSKVLSYLCAGRPILMSAPLENLASRILTESRAGVVVDASSQQAFRDAAVRLRQDQEARVAYGAAARSYAETRFDIDEIASQFERVFARHVVAKTYSPIVPHARAAPQDQALT
jgi:glycosyltransferase involved in cell wall biosynthesis